jgi:N-carbamoylputrescine amidase
MENNKLSTGLTVWLWIIFVVNVLAAIGGIVVALGASVVGAALGLGSIYVVLSFIGVILQIVITVSIGILLFAHKKIGLVLIFAFAALGFIVSMVTYAVTAQLGVVIPVSFYEAGEGRQLFNSVAVIDADGEVLGIYRKTHIPDDHYYQEKFYFTPGNTGFKAFKTRYATIGVGICWDQWFPETARGMALKGAEILFYPTAIGSEPILECDSMPHWRRCMTGHAACNLMPVVAANRIGTEEVVPCAENGNQSSALTFYGSSFITDATGEVVEQMDRVSEGFILHSFDLDELESERKSWGLFRDRRPEMYGEN